MSLTPRFSEVMQRGSVRNRFSGFHARRETAEAVHDSYRAFDHLAEARC